MDFTDWKWLNESQVMIMNEEIAITAPGETDWFMVKPTEECHTGGCAEAI